MIKMKAIVTLLTAFSLCITPLTASAQGRWGNSLSGEEVKEARKKGNMKLADVRAKLERDYGRAGYRSSFEDVRHGRDVYVFRWVTRDGVLRTFVMDAKTGRMLESN